MPFYKMNHQKWLLLSWLKVIGRDISENELQQRSFLSPILGYDFIPYEYGCYSFRLDKDINNLEKSDFIKINNNIISLIIENPFMWIDIDDIDELYKYDRKYAKFNTNDLTHFIYITYPYYAINSKIINQVCSSTMEQYKIKDTQEKMARNDSIIYTLGYEGINLETYINKLIENDIKLLCDVRKNPVSRKLGFSYKSLSTLLPKICIEYIHIQQLGIESSKREKLDNQDAYETLFNEYRVSLPSKEKALNTVLALHKKYKRIALTCFEQDYHQCHRHCVSDYLADKHNSKIVHL